MNGRKYGSYGALPKPPMESQKGEVDGLIQGILKTSSLEKLLEDMDSAITPVLLFLEEMMSNIEVSSGVGLRNQIVGN